MQCGVDRNECRQCMREPEVQCWVSAHCPAHLAQHYRRCVPRHVQRAPRYVPPAQCHGRPDAAQACCTGLRVRPTPAISTSTTSPACKNTFGERPNPTPDGVPVMITVPANSVVPRESSETMRATEWIINDVEESCMTTPFTRVTMRSACGSGTADAGVTALIGQKVSKPLPRQNCPPPPSRCRCHRHAARHRRAATAAVTLPSRCHCAVHRRRRGNKSFLLVISTHEGHFFVWRRKRDPHFSHVVARACKIRMQLCC